MLVTALVDQLPTRAKRRVCPEIGRGCAGTRQRTRRMRRSPQLPRLWRSRSSAASRGSPDTAAYRPFDRCHRQPPGTGGHRLASKTGCFSSSSAIRQSERMPSNSNADASTRSCLLGEQTRRGFGARIDFRQTAVRGRDAYRFALDRNRSWSSLHAGSTLARRSGRRQKCFDWKGLLFKARRQRTGGRKPPPQPRGKEMDSP